MTLLLQSFRRLLPSLTCTIVTVGLFGSAFVGCSDQPESLDAPSLIARISEWDFQKFPQQKQLTLARIPAQIIPAQVQPFYAPDNGSLTLSINSFEASLKSGTLWAEFEPERLQLDAAILENRAQLLAKKRDDLESIQQPLKQLELHEKEQKLRQQIALYKNLAQSNHDPALLHQLVAETNESSIEELLEQKQTALALVQKERLQFNPENTSQSKLELISRDLEQQQAELQFSKRLEYAQFRMFFDGNLQINLETTAPIKPNTYRVQAGQLIAIARNLDQLDAKIAMQNAIWQSIPTSKLNYHFALPSGITLQASYNKKHLDASSRGNELAYYFRIDSTNTPRVTNLSDSIVNGTLVMELEAAAFIIPKIELLNTFPEAFSNGNWNQGIAQIWPSAQLVGEGQTQVAIRMPSLDSTSP